MITAQFNGHSHLDEFNLYYSKENSSIPTSIAWNGASGTPFTYLNPNYRVYYADYYTHVRLTNRFIQLGAKILIFLIIYRKFLTLTHGSTI